MQYNRTVEYYSGVERNEILIHAVTGMNLEDIMLRKNRQTQKATCWRFHLQEVSRIGRSIGTESRLVVARGWEWEMGNDCSFGMGLPFGMKMS